MGQTSWFASIFERLTYANGLIILFRLHKTVNGYLGGTLQT
jgi:hypothetical protein